MGVKRSLNPLRRFSEWYLRREYMKIQKQDQQDKAKQADFQRKVALQRVQILREFIKELNENILPNRRARKNFWLRESKGDHVLEEYLDRIIEHYTPKPKVKVEEVKEKKEEK